MVKDLYESGTYYIAKETNSSKRPQVYKTIKAFRELRLLSAWVIT